MKQVDAYAATCVQDALTKVASAREDKEHTIEAEVQRRYTTRVSVVVTNAFMEGAKQALAKLAEHDASVVHDRHAHILEKLRRGHP